MADAQPKDEKAKIIEKIKNSSNILVALNNNPSVDELSSALAITLLINKMDKHATAIVSGDIPNALQFLEPDKTFEKNVDSLRDFIIALNKDKADHLRYKIDGDFVKVFITPYRTTITEKDLEFSQGDYNVDLVVALNVKDADDLDKALSAHGRILHDADVVDITTDDSGKLGSSNWHGSGVSSLSEMITVLSSGLRDPKSRDTLIDKAIATALLTGIVAATDRFSNPSTTPNSLAIASKLMTHGADQQLIATNLEKLSISEGATGLVNPVDEFSEESLGTVDALEPAPEEEESTKPDLKSDRVNFSVKHNKAGDEPDSVPEPEPEPELSTPIGDDFAYLDKLDNSSDEEPTSEPTPELDITPPVALPTEGVDPVAELDAALTPVAEPSDILADLTSETEALTTPIQEPTPESDITPPIAPPADSPFIPDPSGESFIDLPQQSPTPPVDFTPVPAEPVEPASPEPVLPPVAAPPLPVEFSAAPAVDDQPTPLADFNTVPPAAPDFAPPPIPEPFGPVANDPWQQPAEPTPAAIPVFDSHDIQPIRPPDFFHSQDTVPETPAIPIPDSGALPMPPAIPSFDTLPPVANSQPIPEVPVAIPPPVAPVAPATPPAPADPGQFRIPGS